VLGIIILIIGSAADGFGTDIMKEIVTCISPDGTIYGDKDYSKNIKIYCGGFTDDCSCLNMNSLFSCYFFNGGIAEKSCDNILGDYKSNLKASYALDIVTACVVFMLSVMSCFSICCPNRQLRLPFAVNMPVFRRREGGEVEFAHLQGDTGNTYESDTVELEPADRDD
jgi:hypothetical protein